MTKKYNHKEAFCIMQYRCKACYHNEYFWNSRDGVTPFLVQCPSCGQMECHHVNFAKDLCVPDHKPHIGQRKFVDLTLERATEIADAQIKRFGRTVTPDYRQQIIDSIYHEGMAPDIEIHGYARSKDV